MIIGVFDDVVIGSGPTGWAACEGIWSRGGSPTVIDIGYTNGNQANESVLRSPMVKPKLSFDADYMYSYPLSEMTITSDLSTIPLSGGRGGLSTVWGAGIQPVSVCDLRGVPRDVSNQWMNSSNTLLRKMRYLGRADMLSERDPWPVEPSEAVHLSSRFSRIHRRVSSSSLALDDVVAFGSPRLAIGGRQPRYEGDVVCTLCGQCMTGCPQGVIFDSGNQVVTGIHSRGGRYIQATVLKVVSAPHSTGGNHTIEVLAQLHDGTIVSVLARRLFLAAGAIGSVIILQKSKLIPDRTVIRDSQMFYSSFFSLERYVPDELHMTTSQGYFSTKSGVNERDEFSVSIYESSDDFLVRLRSLVPRSLQFAISTEGVLLKRVLPAIGFLSQDVSGRLVVENRSGEIRISSEDNPETSTALINARRLLGRASRKIGLVQLPNPFSRPPIGSGFHVGASLPMGDLTKSPTDWDGRLQGVPNLRVVDTSSLPRIKAGSHTFMAMANAYRIAANAD